MDFNKYLQSKRFMTVLIVIGALTVLLLVFKAGIFVGYRKARFSYRWAENYHRNFAGPRDGFFGEFRRGFGDREDFINAHGTFGSIIKIDGSTIVVEGKDNIEETIIVSDKTTIVSRRELLKTSDLKVDNQVVVIGSPNKQGQIEAKFIRVFR